MPRTRPLKGQRRKPLIRRKGKVSEVALATARSRNTSQPAQAAPAHPLFFAAAAPTPAKVPKAEQLAADSNITAINGWANVALGSAFNEGVTFLGYAYLAQLAQRPEYRVIAETLATEMTRRWIRFTSKGDKDKTKQISELQDEWARLNVRDMFCRATEQDGFFGRGHIYIDTGDTDNPSELQLAIGDGWGHLSKTKISKKPIKSLRTIEAVWCYPTSYNSNDPLKDNWFRPDSWYVQAKIVHASRLLTLIGREVPDLLKPTYSFGGLSLSQMAKPYVDNWLRTRQSVNDLINAYSVMVLLTDMQQSLQTDGQEIFNRAEIFNRVRSNAGLMMLDKQSEDFKNVSANLGSLDKLQAQAQEHMAFPAHAPIVKLFGQQPAGLNADSEGVLRSYYDYVGAFQDHLFRPPLHKLLGLTMYSLWGKIDPDIGFEFEPLWSLDEKGAAEVRKINAETDQILIDSGQLSPVEGRARVAADPDSGHSSIDVDDVPDLREEEEEGLEPKSGAAKLAEGEIEGEKPDEPRDGRRAA